MVFFPRANNHLSNLAHLALSTDDMEKVLEWACVTVYDFWSRDGFAGYFHKRRCERGLIEKNTQLWHSSSISHCRKTNGAVFWHEHVYPDGEKDCCLDYIIVNPFYSLREELVLETYHYLKVSQVLSGWRSITACAREGDLRRIRDLTRVGFSLRDHTSEYYSETGEDRLTFAFTRNQLHTERNRLKEMFGW